MQIDDTKGSIIEFYKYLGALFGLLIVSITWGNINLYLKLSGVIISILASLGWIIDILRTKRTILLPKVILPLAGFLILNIILTTRAPLPTTSQERILIQFLLLLAFIFFVDSIGNSWKPRIWENALISIALIFAIIEIYLALLWYGHWWRISGVLFSSPPIGYRLTGLFLYHPNIFSGFINLIIPIVIVRFFREEQRSRKVALSCALLLFLFIQYLTSSRGGWLGGLVGILVTLTLFFTPQIRRVLGKGRSGVQNLFSGKTLAVVLTFAILLPGVAFLFIRQASITKHAPIASSRDYIWGPAWKFFSSSPILGNGPGSFIIMYAKETQIPPGWVTDHAHNLWLQIAAENGLAGLLLGLWALSLIAIGFYKAWMHNTSCRPMLAAYAGSMTALLIHHLADYLFGPSLYALTALLIVALAMNFSTPEMKIAVRTRSISYLLASGLAVFILGTAWTSRGAWAYWQGISAAQQDDWTTAQVKFCQAANSYPGFSLYSFQCGLANGYMNNSSNGEEMLSRAVNIIDHELERYPYWPVHWANLAALEWQQGANQLAINHFIKATHDAPRNAFFLFNLGYLQEQLGNEKDASSAYLQALQNDPDMADTVIFANSSIRHIATHDFQLWLRSQSKPLTHIQQGYQFLKAGNLDAAGKEFRTEIDLDPHNARAYAYLALVEQQIDQPEHAWQNAQTALLIDGNSAIVSYIGGRIALEQGRQAKAVTYLLRSFNLLNNHTYSMYYYFGAYGRYAPHTDSVPQLKHATLTSNMIDDFLWLAEYLEEHEDADKANKIRNYIQAEISA